MCSRVELMPAPMQAGSTFILLPAVCSKSSLGCRECVSSASNHELQLAAVAAVVPYIPCKRLRQQGIAHCDHAQCSTYETAAAADGPYRVSSCCLRLLQPAQGSGSWLSRRTAAIAAAAGVTGGETDMAVGLPAPQIAAKALLRTGIGSGLQRHDSMSRRRHMGKLSAYHMVDRLSD
jgi:hypothetical protein